MRTRDWHCRCGKVRGVADFASASRVHVVCHCGDCSAWARHLDRDDATEIVQMAPSQLRLLEGASELRCARLSEKGLTRWYSACCGSPIGNTLRSPRVPFVGLMRSALEADEDLIGPAVHVNGGRRTPVAVVARSAWFLLVSFAARRHRPSPFFEPSGALVSEPIVLQ